MGWADFLGPSNPVQQFVASNRGKLAQIGAGLGSGQNFQSGLAAAAQGLPAGQRTDDAYATQQKAEAERQDAINQTTEWLRNKAASDPFAAELSGLVEGKAITPYQAYDSYLKRSAPGAPIKVGAGETLLDPNTYQPVYQGAPDQKDAFNQEKDLAAQYGQQDPVKTYQAVRNGYERVRASANLASKTPNDSGAADISMIFAYMKMLDPTSVVREGEFATAENAGGVGAQVQNLYNKVINGGRLTPELRAEFLAAADALYAETSSNLSATNSQFGTRAEAWQVDPSRFITQPETYQPLAASMPGGGGADIQTLVDKYR